MVLICLNHHCTSVPSEPILDIPQNCQGRNQELPPRLTRLVPKPHNVGVESTEHRDVDQPNVRHQQWHWGTLRISIYLYIFIQHMVNACTAWVCLGRGSTPTKGRKLSITVNARAQCAQEEFERQRARWHLPGKLRTLLPSGKRLHNYEKSPVLICKSTINHHFRHFPWALGCRPLQWCFLGSLSLVTCRMFVDFCDFRWPPDGGWPCHTLWIIVAPHWWLVCWNHFLSDL